MFATLATCLLLTSPSRAVPAPLSQDERGEVVAGAMGEQLDEYLSLCALFGFSGCVLVEKEGEVLLRKGYGLARADTGRPNTPETLYDIASASKQVTAAAILKLEALGELSTDDSIAEHLPGVPKKHAEVTLHHLLTHTSGFPRGGPAGRGADLASALATYFSGDRSGKPGKRFEYYNGGYAMLAGVVEQVTGEAFEDWVRENLFLPAGMERSDFIETARVDPGQLAASNASRGQLTTQYIKGWGYKGMGGVLTSVSDLALWMRALHAGELLPARQLEKLLTPFKGDYACGWYVFDTDKKRRVVQHGGTAPGFQTYIRHFVDDDVLILVLANCEGMHWQVAWGLSGLVLNENPKAAAPPELAQWNEEDFREVCGTWTGDGGTLSVTRSGAGVTVGGIGGGVVRALTPVSPLEQARGGRPRNASSSAPPKRELEEAEERAMAMVTELREGACELLGADLLPHIPKSWPRRVLTDLWPKHLERWGEVRDQRSLGVFFDPGSKRTRVWIQLDHERGQRSVEVAFVGNSLNIFDLGAKRFPVEVGCGPLASDHLVGFDFTDEPPYELKFRGKRAKRTLELKTRDGEKLRFTRARGEPK